MEKILAIIKEKFTYKHMDLEKDQLDICQFSIFETGEQIDFALLGAKTFHPPHIHEHGSAKIYVVAGSGVITLDSKSQDYNIGQVFDVPKGTAHGFDVHEDTLLLSIQDEPILRGDKLDFRYQ